MIEKEYIIYIVVAIIIVVLVGVVYYSKNFTDSDDSYIKNIVRDEMADILKNKQVENKLSNEDIESYVDPFEHLE